MQQKMALHDGNPLSRGLRQYNQSLLDNMQSEHTLKVEKTRILPGALAWNCPYIIIYIEYTIYIIQAVHCTVYTVHDIT